jgi:hypothetical protein
LLCPRAPPPRRGASPAGPEEGSSYPPIPRPLTFPFLARYSRKPSLPEVSLRTRSLAYPRAYWLEVVEKGGGAAEIDGRITAGEIALRTKRVRKLRLLLRSDLVDLGTPVRVTVNGREAFASRLVEDPALLLRSWRATLDPQLARSAEITLNVR